MINRFICELIKRLCLLCCIFLDQVEQAHFEISKLNSEHLKLVLEMTRCYASIVLCKMIGILKGFPTS